MNVRTLLIAVLCVTVSLTGCTTMRPVDLGGQEPVTARVKPNDLVRVWLRDGRTLDLRLTAVEADTLVTRDQRVPLKDVVRLERLDINWVRTSLLLLGMIVLGFVGYAASCAPFHC